MIKFRCSNCNKKFGVPNDYAGRRIRCNTCDHHTLVPNASIEPPDKSDTSRPDKAANDPTPYQDKTDNDIVLSLSEKDAPAVSGTPAQNTAPDIQLQSFHRYSPSDSVIAGPASKPTPKNSVSELLKRCRPDPRTDRTQLALNTLSFISCIGPVFFILMFFYVMMAMAIGDSPRAMAAHHTLPAEPNIVSTSDPNTLSKHNPFSAMPASRIVRYSFYAVCFVISPMALILSFIIVFRYAFDMPKTLYFAIVVYGFIFFTIFRG
jgi:DNA-directed RNA polymerase subunit RPC12/RpoP